MKKRVLSLLLAAILIFSVMSGCKSREAAPESSGSSVSSSSGKSSSSKSEEKAKTVESALPGMVKYVTEKKELNSDTVGWLQIGNLGVDEVVVQNLESNKYYERLNFEKQYDFNGIFYADKKAVFGSGSLADIGVNTCIYGHALTDDSENSKFNVKMGPLHSFRDPEIAKKIPYIFFSTEKEDLAYEVIAVFIPNVTNINLPYNTNDYLKQDEFCKMVREEILPRSIYDYGVEIKDDDKFLTLSTCIYVLPDGTPTHYPNTYYRYAVMGRLVKPGDALKEEANIKENTSVIIDPNKDMR